MSIPRRPQQAKLIASVLFGEPGIDHTVIQRLAAVFGPTDLISPELPFDFTDYYTAEMGAPLLRRMIGFERLIDPEELPEIKLRTNQIETALARADGSRRVNIDPGYVTLWHLVLASCKPFAHRPYLGRGVYADLTLLYRGKTFVPLAWTFPDYRSAQMIGLLNGMRERYHRQIKQSQESGVRSQKPEGRRTHPD